MEANRLIGLRRFALSGSLKADRLITQGNFEVKFRAECSLWGMEAVTPPVGCDGRDKLHIQHDPVRCDLLSQMNAAAAVAAAEESLKELQSYMESSSENDTVDVDDDDDDDVDDYDRDPGGDDDEAVDVDDDVDDYDEAVDVDDDDDDDYDYDRDPGGGDNEAVDVDDYDRDPGGGDGDVVASLEKLLKYGRAGKRGKQTVSSQKKRVLRVDKGRGIAPRVAQLFDSIISTINDKQELTLFRLNIEHILPRMKGGREIMEAAKQSVESEVIRQAGMDMVKQAGRAVKSTVVGLLAQPNAKGVPSASKLSADLGLSRKYVYEARKKVAEKGAGLYSSLTKDGSRKVQKLCKTRMSPEHGVCLDCLLYTSDAADE